MKLKRNAVVYDYTDDQCTFYHYGRVVRFIDPCTVLWINCNDEIHITRIHKLKVVDYKGRWEYGLDGKRRYWIPMPTLRELKQRASNIHGRNALKTPVDYSGIWEK